MRHAFEKASDHALEDINHKFCVHCTDEQGQLKPYEEILSGIANYLVHSQGVAMTAANEIAKDSACKDNQLGEIEMHAH